MEIEGCFQRLNHEFLLLLLQLFIVINLSLLVIAIDWNILLSLLSVLYDLLDVQFFLNWLLWTGKLWSFWRLLKISIFIFALKIFSKLDSITHSYIFPAIKLLSFYILQLLKSNYHFLLEFGCDAFEFEID